MKVAITGGHGFLGWHTACRLRSTRGIESVRLGRAEFANGTLASAVAEADVVLHIAGVNRGETDEAVEQGNVDMGVSVAAALRASQRPAHVVYASSVQARLDNPYGRGKARAGEVLRAAAHETGGTLTEVLLPNLFGEHGRPGYNSFVATFSHEIARGRTPTVLEDREMELLHAQRAAEVLIRAAEDGVDGVLEPRGEPSGVSQVLGMLQTFDSLYVAGEIPDLSSSFALDLFNSYRSYCFPQQFPLSPQVHSDQRGRLFETHRTHGGTGQTFVSTTVPGSTRGDHYHLHRIERFCVVAGEAEIALRRLYADDVVRFRVSGEEPSYVDMPTMWVHNITNVGDDDLVTIFWSDQLLDPANPDQYPEHVETVKSA